MVNTKNSIVADRYSNALVRLVQEGRISYEKISEDLVNIKETLSKSKDLAEFLENPIISADDKKEIINRIFSSEVDALILNFLKVLIDKNRFITFYEIYESYSKTVDSIKNISRVNVVSAVQIPDDAKARLKEKLEYKLKKSVILDLDIDSNIIAGLIIKIGDDVIDMSLKHKLEDLSKNITR